MDETITESEIWADIDKVFALPPRLPGDIDCRQLMAHYGLTETGARSRMEALARQGWEIVTVTDDTSASGRRKVVRRKG